MIICAMRRHFGGGLGFLPTPVCAPTLGGGVPAKCDIVALLSGGRNGRDPSHPAPGNKRFDSGASPFGHTGDQQQRNTPLGRIVTGSPSEAPLYFGLRADVNCFLL